MLIAKSASFNRNSARRGGDGRRNCDRHGVLHSERPGCDARRAKPVPRGPRGMADRTRSLRVSVRLLPTLSTSPGWRCACSRRFRPSRLCAELTTRQAAEPLQVSGTRLVQLLDEGRISCRKVGTHRHVRAQAILAYYREIDRVVAQARCASCALCIYSRNTRPQYWVPITSFRKQDLPLHLIL